MHPMHLLLATCSAATQIAIALSFVEFHLEVVYNFFGIFEICQYISLFILIIAFLFDLV